VAKKAEEAQDFLQNLEKIEEEYIVDFLVNSPSSVNANRECVLAAVSKLGYALEYAAEQLKADKGLVLAAVTRHGWALEYAADQLKADKAVVRQGIASMGDHPGHAALSAAVSCSLGNTLGNGASIEPAPTAGMSRNLHFAATTTACGVGS